MIRGGLRAEPPADSKASTYNIRSFRQDKNRTGRFLAVDYRSKKQSYDTLNNNNNNIITARVMHLL